MEYVAVLTPPFLMAGVVVFAIVAFLRHEMRRGAREDAALAEDILPPAVGETGARDNEHVTESGDEDAPATHG